MTGKFRFLLFSAFFIGIFFGCQPEPNTPERPADPWVFRSVLDSMPRMITLALHRDLWVAYHTESGALYKAWQGNVNLAGAVYTTEHGPQPGSVGDIWMENPFKSPWQVKSGNQVTPISIQYRGHRFEDGHARLQYELILPDGQKLMVSEQPEAIFNESQQIGFQRIFSIDGKLPSGMELQLQTRVNSIAFAKSVKTNGKFDIQKEEAYTGNNHQWVTLTGTLTLNPKGSTEFTAWLIKEPAILNPIAEEASEDEETPLAEQLIAQSGCRACHNPLVKTVGPAYIEVARKYENSEENLTLLTSKIINGGAGVWGQAMMIPHPHLAQENVEEMVRYILAMDANEEKAKASNPLAKLVGASAGMNLDELIPGAASQIYQFEQSLRELADVNWGATPVYEGPLPEIHFTDSDFKGLKNRFAILAQGYLNVPKDNNYVFRLSSDDGSRLTLHDQVIIDYDGLHGAGVKDGEIALKAGLHPFRLEYFQNGGGKSISLKWRSFDDGEFAVIPTTSMFHHPDQLSGMALPPPPMIGGKPIPGSGYALQEVHPSFSLSQARPEGFEPKVGGLDFLPDGRLVVSTWTSDGAVYVLDGVQSGDPSQIKVKQVASGFAEPLGLKVVEGEIYILQKQELTKLIDHDGDDIIDEYRTVCNGWEVTSNFHEFAFGLVEKDGFLYGTLAIGILPGGASAYPQSPDRGKVIKIDPKTGEYTFVAHGLRTPNGIGIGIDDQIFVADNQGDWLPASKILHIEQGDFFGSQAVDPEGTAELEMKKPVVWLPQDEIGNSPSTPSYLNIGPYIGQMIHGEVTHGGLKRVFVEKVNGQYQGALFRFVQGLEAGVNRIVWGPDGALYVGGVGSNGNWQHSGKQWFGLQRLAYNGNPAFEMLAVRAKTNGLEIEFTEPLAEGLGWNTFDYKVQQWWYKPTAEYGGPKMDLEDLNVLSANVSADRKKVFLELDGIKEGHVVYVNLPSNWTSENYQEIWTTEVWYTLNNIPEGREGFKTEAPNPIPPNTLSEQEKEAGWKLLFDGKSLKGWHNYNKTTVGSSWIVQEDAIYLNAKQNAEGNWSAPDGGDILTDQEFQNFELALEWKISPCGNSGIFYNIKESEDISVAWKSAPEMQVLDNSCHPDAKIEKHRAGDLYDLIQCKYETVKPTGSWNQVRIRIKDGHLEHWLNGRKVVETEMWTDNWNDLVASSKFKNEPEFGKYKKGRIGLQDHDNPVWFRNIKIREL